MKLSSEELFEYLEFAKDFSGIAGKIMLKYFNDIYFIKCFCCKIIEVTVLR